MFRSEQPPVILYFDGVVASLAETSTTTQRPCLCRRRTSGRRQLYTGCCRYQLCLTEYHRRFPADFGFKCISISRWNCSRLLEPVCPKRNLTIGRGCCRKPAFETQLSRRPLAKHNSWRLVYVCPSRGRSKNVCTPTGRCHRLFGHLGELRVNLLNSRHPSCWSVKV